MIGALLFTFAHAQVPQIIARPLPRPVPQSRPLFEMSCNLRDLDSRPAGQIALRQTGGVYGMTEGGFPARSAMRIRFMRDDLAIFGADEFDLTGAQSSDWHSDGPIELSARSGAGSLVIHKTTKKQAWFESPAKIAVTVKGGRRVRSPYPDRTWEKFLLVGSCDVSWTKQASEPAPRQDREKS